MYIIPSLAPTKDEADVNGGAARKIAKAVGKVATVPANEPRDEVFGGPPPHPLDRPWMHPTEMFARADARSTHVVITDTKPRSNRLAFLVSGALIGALAMLAALFTSGAIGDGSSVVRVKEGHALPVHGALDLQIDDEGEPSGTRIVAIEPGGASASSDLGSGDVIAAIDGVPVDGTTALVREVRSRLPGETVELKILRDGVSRVVTIVLATAGEETTVTSSSATSDLPSESPG